MIPDRRLITFQVVHRPRGILSVYALLESFIVMGYCILNNECIFYVFRVTKL